MDKLKPVVFLDRDGTLNEEVGYIHKLQDLVLIEGAGDAIRKLNQAGVATVLVTNQSGAARGYYSEEHVNKLNARLCDLLASENAFLDAVYYCPHLPEGMVEHLSFSCDCRKPGIGMVQFCYQEHPEFDPDRAYVVGDKVTDIELAHNCKAKSVLVRTGYGSQIKIDNNLPDFIAADITEAIDWILTDLEHAK